MRTSSSVPIPMYMAGGYPAWHAFTRRRLRPGLSEPPGAHRVRCPSVGFGPLERLALVGRRVFLAVLLALLGRVGPRPLHDLAVAVRVLRRGARDHVLEVQERGVDARAAVDAVGLAVAGAEAVVALLAVEGVARGVGAAVRRGGPAPTACRRRPRRR